MSFTAALRIGDSAALLPGFFVRVRVPVTTRQDALMVPEAALGSNQLGSYLLVVNAAPHDAPELVRSLRDDIRRQVNEGVDDRHFTVLHGDACSPDDLRGKILGPALEHLARLVALAANDFTGTTNPRPAAAADYEQFFRQAM